MRATRRAVLSVGAGLASGFAFGAPASGALRSNFVQPIAPGIYAHFGQLALTTPANEGDIANLAFVIGKRAVAVIDTGGSVAVGARLLEAVRAVTDKPVRYVVNTHEHPDHVFGNAAFLGTGCVFVGHHNLPNSLARRGPYYLRSYRDQLGAAAIAEVRIVPPTLLVHAPVTLDLGGRRLRLAAWSPAHSDCDLTVFDDATGTLLSGDLDFLEHVPVVDGSLEGWLDVLRSLPDIPARMVLPGHGRLIAAWPVATDDERRYLERLKADSLRMIAEGVPLEAATARIGISERSRWELFNAYNGRNATVAYTELEWE